MESLRKIAHRLSILEDKKKDTELSLSETQKRLKHRHVLTRRTQTRLLKAVERLKVRGRNLKDRIRNTKRAFDRKRGAMVKTANKPTITWLDENTAVISYELAQPIFLHRSPELYDHIKQKASELWTKTKKKRDAGIKRLVGGQNTARNIQLIFISDPSKSGAQEVPRTAPKLSDIPQICSKIAHEHHKERKNGTDQFVSPSSVFLARIEFLITAGSQSGGCLSRKRKKLVPQTKELFWEMHSPKSSANNCGIGCLVLHKQTRGFTKVSRPHILRKILGIKKGSKLKPTELLLVAKSLGYEGFYLMNENFETKAIGKPTDKSPTLWLKEDHYWLAKKVSMPEKVSEKVCEECGQKYKQIHSKSDCLRRKNFRAHKFMQKNYIITQNKKTVKNFWGIFFDIETINERFADSKVVEKTRKDGTTYTEAEGILKPYAIGWLDNRQGDYNFSNGKRCMDEFMEMLKSLKPEGSGRQRTKPTYVGWNSSAFDTQFLLKELLKHNLTPTKLIVNNNRIILLEWENGRVFDLCSFVMSDLRSACEDFGVEKSLCKGDFDHTKIESWADVKKYEKEWIPYLKNDVLALEAIFKKFQSTIERDFGMSPSQYVSLPHLSWNCFTAHLKYQVEIPTQDKIEFINQSIFGGRSTPFQQYYCSGEYLSTLEEWELVRKKYERLKKQYGRNVKGLRAHIKHDREFDRMRWKYECIKMNKDYVFPADAMSLYPASFIGVPQLNINVRYPIGDSHWSDKPKLIFENGYLGFFEVSWKSPQEIFLPVLPTRTKTGISWALGSGRGIYTSVDIENAIAVGYEIKFIGSCLYYPKSSSQVFTEYVKKVIEGKVSAEKEGNTAKRTAYKLLANSLFGRCLMRATKEQTSIIQNSTELLEFYTSHHLKTFSVIESEDNTHLVVSGSKRDATTITRRPKALGALVLAYSRRIMLHYFKVLSPDLSNIDHCYITDTDSVYCHASGEEILRQNGCIKDDVLGLLNNDLKNNGIVLKMKNLAPKMYAYVSLNDLGILEITTKCKGIGKELLDPEWYWKEETKKVSWCGIKKAGRYLTKKQKKRGVSAFDLLSQFYSRTFNPNWAKMDLVHDVFVPKGYQGKRYKK